MKRLAVVLLLLASSVPLTARVISYAPYTDRIAVTGYHERTTRWFVLFESSAGNASYGQVVLYDSTGAEEPRVIYPQDGGSTYVDYVALYERKAPAAAGLPPMILVGGAQLVFSPDGGGTWKEISGLTYSWHPRANDLDVGGPFVGGLSNSILPGNDEYPFLISFSGIRAIHASGTQKVIYADGGARLIGRNAAGDRFLVRAGQGILNLGLQGQSAFVTTGDPAATYSGWITPDGSVYLQMLRLEGRFLFLKHGTQLLFIAGPYDTQPPSPFLPPQTFPTNRFLAVPTHDFNGAWMIQREQGKPTTLLRHQPGGALETMWVDEDGPRVEALIAGASGQTLLVQVHRDRDGAEQMPLIDPALAVWHVGQPAPSEYDELYLNEQWNKGFVHVDVDRIESGEPFVFNSGVTQFVPDIIVSPAPGGGDVIQEWGVVRASLRQTLVLPGVARAPGAFNSHWLTDVTVHNPSDAAQDVEIRFASINQEVHAAFAGPSTTITLEPHEIRVIPDALRTLFAMESGGGTLHVLPARSVSVAGRTYSRREDGGTFGFGMQAIDFYNAVGSRFALTFAGAYPGQHFRTNILLTDTSGRGSAVELKPLVPVGHSSGNTLTVSAPAGGTAQYNNLGQIGSGGGGLLLQPKRGTSIPMVVSIDNRTNDPTYFPPDRPALIPRFIPVIGHLEGAFGAQFRSDLYLLNPSQEQRTVALAATLWDAGLTSTATLTMHPGETRVVPDALFSLFGLTGAARLRFDSGPWADGIRVTSRTYNVEESGATYGCLIPPLNSFQIATTNERLEILGPHGGTTFRNNLGLVELSGMVDGRVTIRIIGSAGQVLREFEETVRRDGGKQINNLDVGPGAARIVVEVHEGTIGAYATLTDNITNDSSYLAAHLGAKGK